MFDHRTQTEYQTGLPVRITAAGDHPAGFAARLAARLMAGRLDRQLTDGAVPQSGSALAIHAQRLQSRDERDALAHALRRAVANAESQAHTLTWHAPIHRRGVLAARTLIDDVTLLLRATRPVNYRAVARLRVLMADGTGPLYRAGRGSLTAELKAVLARM